jgi:hypothetical protein
MTLLDDDVEVTITISRAAYERAWEIVSERDPDMRLRFDLLEELSIEEYLAVLLEEKLR